MTPSPSTDNLLRNFNAKDPRWTIPGLFGPADVSPDIAAQLLDDFNVHNRPISWRKVRDYAAQMTSGFWRYNPSDAIGVDREARLANGQHRLLAVVEAGTVQPFAFATGVELDVQDVMDSGIRRTSAHQLALRGYGDANALAAIARTVLHWRDGTVVSRLRPPTTLQILEFLENSPPGALDFAITAGKRVSSLFPLRAGIVAGAAYEAFLADEGAAKEFFDAFCDGVGLSARHPVLTLRNYLLRQQQLKVSIRVHHQLWLLVSTWNTWRAGRTLGKIMSPSVWTADSFPVMS